MSNPALFVAPLASSLAYTDRSGSGVLTGVDPIRHMGAGGLLLEDAGTNLITSPLSPALFAYPHLTLSSVTGQDIDHPDWPVHTDRYRHAVISSSPGFANQAAFQTAVSTPASGTVGVVQIVIRFSAERIGDLVHLYAAEGGGSSGTEYHNISLNVPVTGDWQMISGSFAFNRSDRTVVYVYCDAAAVGDMDIGSTFDVTFCDVRVAPYVTSPIPSVDSSGTALAGYAFTGTAHNSSSTRAASSASVPTAGIISPNSGSLAFRFTRKLDTGTLEPILEVGENAAGYDHLQIFIDADTLWVAWDSEGALPQTIDTGHTMVVDQEYFIYTYWDDLVFGVSIDNGTPIVSTRDVPTGDWGTFPLTLAAE